MIYGYFADKVSLSNFLTIIFSQSFLSWPRVKKWKSVVGEKEQTEDAEQGKVKVDFSLFRQLGNVTSFAVSSGFGWVNKPFKCKHCQTFCLSYN